jgi:hypothetical protein
VRFCCSAFPWPHIHPTRSPFIRVLSRWRRVGDAFLRAEIEKHGHDGVCFYCGGDGKTFSIGEMADRTEVAFDQHFYRTPDEPSGMEYAMMKEGDYVWERKGDSVADVIQDFAQVETRPAEDIQSALEQRHFDMELAKMGEEQAFAEDTRYAKGDVDDAESYAGWRQFERRLKTEARYFSRTAEWKIDFIFEGITEHTAQGGRQVVVEAGPGMQIAALYRARAFQSDEKLEEALKRPEKEVGPPPFRVASAGRMNAHGISVFYGATDPMIALAEVWPPVGSRVIVGRFELTRPVRLLDVEALRSLNVEGSIFDKDYIQRIKRAKFLEWLSHRITRPVMPDDEPFDYLATQAVADFLATNANPLLDGILYPSVQGSLGKQNVVLFHKAARVQPLDIPKGAEISASLYDSTEDGWEINYRVSEEVPFEKPSTIRGADDLIDMFPRSAESLISYALEDHDERPPTLRLDASSLEVHQVSGIVFQTDAHSVHRHRFEKRESKVKFQRSRSLSVGGFCRTLKTDVSGKVFRRDFPTVSYRNCWLESVRWDLTEARKGSSYAKHCNLLIAFAVHAISSTFLGSYDKSEFANRVEIAGDYSEAFDYANTEPDLAAVTRQRVTAEKFRQLESRAASPIERERLGYFAGFVTFMVPYCDAYETAHKLDAILKHAVELRAAGKADAARAEVTQRGVPLWLAMAPLVRRAMIEYQAVIATRNDLGKLSSMQNKFVRIALERLRLSVKEFVNELPAEVNHAYAAAVSPEAANSPRVFVPTRPSLLRAGDSLRIFIIAPGLERIAEVRLLTRRQNTEEWQTQPAAHAGCSVYTAQLGPFQEDNGAIEYYATAADDSEIFRDPPQAPSNVYTLNVLV